MLKSVLQSKLFTALAALAIGFFLVLIFRLFPSFKTVSQEVKNLDKKIVETEKELSELEKLSNYFKNPAYLEREARLKLNYKRPGENVVFVYRNQSLQNQAENSNSIKPSPVLPNWQKWLKYLLDN
jgi:cell division protein FtsB